MIASIRSESFFANATSSEVDSSSNCRPKTSTPPSKRAPDSLALSPSPAKRRSTPPFQVISRSCLVGSKRGIGGSPVRGAAAWRASSATAAGSAETSMRAASGARPGTSSSHATSRSDARAKAMRPGPSSRPTPSLNDAQKATPSSIMRGLFTRSGSPARPRASTRSSRTL